MKGVGLRRVRQRRHAHAGEAPLYLDHWQDEVNDGAGVQQVVPRLASEQLAAKKEETDKRYRKTG